MKPQEIELTTRQLKTYALIEWNSKNNKLTSQREIYEEYPITKFKDGYVWNDDPHIHDHCSQIWHDIERLNFAPTIDKIIVCKNFTYKFADSDKEALECADCFLKKGLKALKRHWRIVHKVKANGQGNVFSPDEYIEAYLKKGLNDEEQETD